MPRYILTRFTTPISESYSTLDEALAECRQEDGRYIIDVRSAETNGQYHITVADNVMTLTYRD
jgi:hypothetical protein